MMWYPDRGHQDYGHTWCDTLIGNTTTTAKHDVIPLIGNTRLAAILVKFQQKPVRRFLTGKWGLQATCDPLTSLGVSLILFFLDSCWSHNMQVSIAYCSQNPLNIYVGGIRGQSLSESWILRQELKLVLFSYICKSIETSLSWCQKTFIVRLNGFLFRVPLHFWRTGTGRG